MTPSLQQYIPASTWFSRYDRQALILASVLILGDLFFLLLHLGLNFGMFSDRLLHLEVDNGYAEQYQYFKLAIGVLLLGYLFFTRRGFVRVVLAVLLGFILFEDIFQLHEDFYLIGERFISLEAWGPLTRRGLWELIYGLAAGGGLLGLFLLGIFRTRDAELRKRMVILCLLLLAFGGFGIVVDAIHGLFQHAGGMPYTESFFGIVEDWGEMLTISLIVALIIDDLYRTAPEKVLSGGPR
ncbi:hypothetical protein [Lewinella sp. IMCC34191]|uniref:hypothetical protein n=1 Tax=Lewinella sp. IMCC34191 TaxID=2259172 RepID=UPI000E2442B7|nr:hypothetical protein [Lewinella sp. IMCC34191]